MPHLRARATGRAAPDRTGCRRSPRRGRLRRRRRPFAEKLSSLIRRQGAELDPGQRRRTMRPLECCRKRSGVWRGRSATADQHGRRRRPAQQRAEQLDRRRVGPMEVVEHEHERPRLRELLEQRAHRTMAAIALVLERHRSAACERRQRREDVRELGLHLVVEGGELLRVEAPDVLIQRIARRPRTAGRARARTPTPQRTRCPRSSARAASSREQTRLADPRLAHQLDRARAASIELVEQLLERIELVGAAHEGSARALVALRPRASSRLPPSAVAERPHDRGARVIGGSTGRRSVLSTDPGRRAPRLRARPRPVRADESRVAASRESGCRFRVMPRCQAAARAASSTHVPLPASAPARAAGVRRRLRLVQGTREPASPPGDPRLVPLRRARDLVDGRRRERGGRAPAAARPTSPSAPPSRASARSRSHDRERCSALTALDQGRAIEKIRVRDQGVRPMSAAAAR